MRHARRLQIMITVRKPSTTQTRKELGYKIEEDEAQIGFKRVKDDYRVNIFLQH